MSNAYCSVDQLITHLDTRTVGMLANDDGQRSPERAKVQDALDAAAAELESHLAAWVTVPPSPVSVVLTQWVARKVKGTLYGRRSDKPRAVDDDLKWCDDWISSWDMGLIVLPGVARNTFEPALTGRAKAINERAVTGLLTGTDSPSTW